MSKLLSIIIPFTVLISMITFCISTVSSLQEQYTYLIYGIEIFCLSVFIFEYIYNVIHRKLQFIISLQSLIELLVIVPFFFGINSIFLRIFRLLRFLKILKVLNLVKAEERIKSALFEIKNELLLFSFLAVFIVFFASAGIYTFEHVAQPQIFSNIFDSFWWSIITLTVGSDVQPITVAGKIFTAIILFTGLGIVAVPTGLLASALSKKN